MADTSQPGDRTETGKGFPYCGAAFRTMLKRKSVSQSASSAKLPDKDGVKRSKSSQPDLPSDAAAVESKRLFAASLDGGLLTLDEPDVARNKMALPDSLARSSGGVIVSKGVVRNKRRMLLSLPAR